MKFDDIFFLTVLFQRYKVAGSNKENIRGIFFGGSLFRENWCGRDK